MLSAFLIMLREGIEAALIVGIIASYLKQSGHGRAMPALIGGVVLAMLMCFGVGWFINAQTGEIPQREQELWVGVIGLLAVLVLTGMTFWMKKAARSIKSELHESINKALNNGRWQMLSLLAMSFFAVAREGLESVFFLLAAIEQGRENGALLGAILGMVASVAIGYGLYQGGVRINLAKFFKWTGAFIIVVAAGLLAGSLRALHEAGVWNHLQALVFDWSSFLPVHSVMGVFLSGVFGYTPTPTVGEVWVWATYLVVALWWYFRDASATELKAPVMDGVTSNR